MAESIDHKRTKNIETTVKQRRNNNNRWLAQSENETKMLENIKKLCEHLGE